jgi:hemolysin activation/secretion protein
MNIPTVQDVLILPRLLCLAIFAIPSLVAAQETKDSTKFQRYLLVPFVAYAEETGGQIGFLNMIFSRPTDSGEPGDMLTASGVITTQGQKLFLIGPGGTAAHGKIRYSAFLQYSDWPGKYWAGGNQPSEKEWTYSMSSYRLNGSIYGSTSLLSFVPDSVGRHLWGGLQFDLEKNKTDFDAPGDSMAMALGLRSGGNRIGFGPMLQWDSRDNQGWPARGLLLSAGQLYNRKAWGNDWDFTKSTLDLRGYVPLPWSTVLALGGFWEGVDGQVPFDRLAMPDGSNRMRGLSKGRLRDEQQLVLQSELRIPLVWRFSSVVFAEAGKVGQNLSELQDKGFHYGLGAGVRISVNPQRKLNFRTDVAWVDGGIGAAASFAEAF